jgi:hypothetical protein
MYLETNSEEKMSEIKAKVISKIYTKSSSDAEAVIKISDYLRGTYERTELQAQQEAIKIVKIIMGAKNETK